MYVNRSLIRERNTSPKSLPVENGERLCAFALTRFPKWVIDVGLADSLCVRCKSLISQGRGRPGFCFAVTPGLGGPAFPY